MMQYQQNAIYWVDIEKVVPNPFQPRHSFKEDHIMDLASSIRQYGILQPLVVTKQERVNNSDGMDVCYELIAGERRLRASKIIGLQKVPVIISDGESNDKLKLELAIVENVQREDLNPIDRAKAFKQLIDKFNLKHSEVAQKVGKSREYISNSIRLLSLPNEIFSSIESGLISEGHARSMLMLSNYPEQQEQLHQDIISRKLTVREAELTARAIAKEKVRPRHRNISPEAADVEREIAQRLGTRVIIEPKEDGGKITIDYFSKADLEDILSKIYDSHMELTEKEEGTENIDDSDDLYLYKNFSL